MPTSGTATFTVSTVDDSVDKSDGSVTATVAAASGYTAGTASGTVAVSDNDVTQNTTTTDSTTCVTSDTALVGQVDAKVTRHTGLDNTGLVEMFTRVAATMRGTDTYTIDDIKARPDRQWGGWQTDGVNELWKKIYTELDRLEACRSTKADPPTTPSEPSVSVAAGSGVTEGAAASFTVTAAPPPASALTVNVAVAQSGDYAASGATGTKTVTIPTSGIATYTVATVDDSVDEADGSVTVTVKAGSGYTVSATSAATVSVIDDDDDQIPAGPGVTVSATVLTVQQAGQQSFTVVLNQAPTATVYLTASSLKSSAALVSTPDGSHETYANPSSSTSITFDAGDWNTPKTIRVHGQNPGTAEIVMYIFTTDPAYIAVTAPSVTATTE